MRTAVAVSGQRTGVASTCSSVRVAKQDADGCAVGLALKDAGPDFRDIFFLALRDDVRLPRTSAAQVRQQIVHAQFQPRRTAVNDGEVSRPMADARRGDAKQ